MAPGGLLAFSNGRMVASFQIARTTPLEKLSLRVDDISAMVIGLRALKKVVGMSSVPAAFFHRNACIPV